MVYAGLMQRFWAYVIDVGILAIIFVMFSKFMWDTFVAHPYIIQSIGAACFVIYFSFADSAIFKGQSIGKRVMSLQVVDQTGYNCLSLQQSFIRAFFSMLVLARPELIIFEDTGASMPAILRLLSTLIFILPLAFVHFAIIHRPDKRMIYDLIVRSCVITTDNENQTVSPHYEPTISKSHKQGLICIALVVLMYGIFDISAPRANSISGAADNYASLIKKADLPSEYVLNTKVKSTFTLFGKDSGTLAVAIYVSKQALGDEEKVNEIYNRIENAFKNVRGYAKLNIQVKSTVSFGFFTIGHDRQKTILIDVNNAPNTGSVAP